MTNAQAEDEIVQLLNEAVEYDLSPADRKRYIFRFRNLLRQKPGDYRIQTVLSTLYCREGDGENARRIIDNVSIRSIASDYPALGSFINANILLFRWDRAAEALSKLSDYFRSTRGYDHGFVSIAALLGDVNTLSMFSEMETGNGGDVASRTLALLHKNGLWKEIGAIQKEIGRILEHNLALSSHFYVVEDPETGIDEGLTFVHRLDLPFRERWKLQRAVGEYLSGINLPLDKHGRGSLLISHVIAGIEKSSENAA